MYDPDSPILAYHYSLALIHIPKKSNKKNSTEWKWMTSKVGLGLFEKYWNDQKLHIKSILDTFPEIIVKNIWCTKDILFNTKLDFEGK